jgi:hypothetical protein
MGCDIHVYVEYSKDGKYWKNLTENFGQRDYRMFGIMAGVRWEEGKLFDPKGLPEGRLSFDTERAHWCHVAPDSHPEWADGDDWISKETAERWISNGYSQPEYVDGALKRVTNPDHHSHSWLTTAELEQCVNRYLELSDTYKPVEWIAILAAMKAIDECGSTARVVFWFDN